MRWLSWAAGERPGSNAARWLRAPWARPLSRGNRRCQAVQQALQPYLGSLIVTPKEVDLLSEELADVVAGGINLALHPAIDEDEIYQYLQ